MPFGLRKRKRFERIASLDLPPSQWERAWTGLRRRDVLGRIGLALLAAVSMCAVIHGWHPPFAYRTGYVPPRDIVAAVKKSGVPVEYVVFPDEGHGFTKKKNQIEAWGRILEFLDKHLKS